MGAQLEQFSNLAVSTLNGDISTLNGVTIVVADASPFPAITASGCYRIVVDSEVMLVTSRSGNTLTVTRGYEGSQPATHTSGATVLHGYTGGMMSMLSNRGVGYYNFFEAYPDSAQNFTDFSAKLQYWALDVQLLSMLLKTSALDDTSQRPCVMMDIGRIRQSLTSPFVLPERTMLRHNGCFVRTGTAGVITSNYDGDPTSRALANLYQPAIIGVPCSQIESLNLLLKSGTSDTGSGLVFGKNWVPSGVTLRNPGLNFAPGQVLDLAQPSKSPFIGTQVTVDSVDPVTGAIVTYHMSRAGAYALPDKLQRYQWTVARGFTASGATPEARMVLNGVSPSNPAITLGQVFDPVDLAAGVPAFLSKPQTGVGTGATFTQQWKPDWAAGNTQYYGGLGLGMSSKFGDLEFTQGGNASNDATYGTQFDFWLYGLNYVINSVQTHRGGNGIYLFGCNDIRVNNLNNVQGNTGLQANFVTSTVCKNVVLDTPINNYLKMDNCQGLILHGRAFHNTSSPNLTSGPAFLVGQDASSNSSTTGNSVGCELEFMCQGVGSPSGSTLLAIDHVKKTRVKLQCTNYDLRGIVTQNFVNKFVQFGNDIDAGCVIEGSIDWGGLFPPTTGGSNPSAIPSAIYNVNGTPIPIWSGQMPRCKVSIENSDVVGTGVPGVLDNTGNYTISGSTPPTTGNWPQNTKMINTNPAAGNPRGWYCSVAGTGNNGGTWLPL